MNSIKKHSLYANPWFKVMMRKRKNLMEFMSKLAVSTVRNQFGTALKEKHIFTSIEDGLLQNQRV